MNFAIILTIIILLIAVNGFYVAAEFSSVSVRRARLAQLADDGNAAARTLLPILEDPQKLDRYISTCQLGITVASLTLGFYGQSNLVAWLEPQLARLGAGVQPWTQPVATALILLVLTTLQVILGELAPKNVGLRYPEQLAILTAPPMRWSQTIFRPLIWLLNGAALAILRVLGVRVVNEHAHIHSPEEIMILVEESSAGGVLDQEERRLLVNTLQLRHVTARRVMIPRNRMLAAAVDQPVDDLFTLLAASNYSRLPLYETSIDHIVGVVHLKDLLLLLHKQAIMPHGQVADMKVDLTVRSEMHPVLHVPDSTFIEEVLIQMQRAHLNLAIVIDEYGGTAGMIALEDLVEEIIGEFQDEFDPANPALRLQPDNRLWVRGDVDLADLNQRLALYLPANGANTIGGLVVSLLGKIPRVGDQVAIGERTIQIEKMEQNRVAEVSIALSPEQIKQFQAGSE
ncbi:MAG: hemolysin family protein [Chloroflexota bacterium]|nr:hemolysin family protein [Chloroflexota bacterium]